MRKFKVGAQPKEDGNSGRAAEESPLTRRFPASLPIPPSYLRLQCLHVALDEREENLEIARPADVDEDLAELQAE